MKRRRLEADPRTFEFTLANRGQISQADHKKPKLDGAVKAAQSGNRAPKSSASEEATKERTKEEGVDDDTGLGNLDALPVEVLFYALSFLTARELGVIAQLNCAALRAASDDFLWRALCLRSEAVRAKYTYLHLVFWELEANARSSVLSSPRNAWRINKGRKIGRDGEGECWKQMYKFVTRPCVCRRCKISFIELENKPNSCAHHEAWWIDSLNPSEARWKCCKSKDKNDPGCIVEWHVNNCSWLAL